MHIRKKRRSAPAGLGPRRFLLLCTALLLGSVHVGPGGHTFLSPALAQARQSLIVSFIDIGQGDAALLETPSGKNILIDSGPPGGQEALFAYLKRRRVRRIDLHVISHPHRDHYGGTRRLIEKIPVTQIMDTGLVTGSGDQKGIFAAALSKNPPVPFITVATVDGEPGIAGTSVSLGDGITMRVMQPKTLLRGISDIENNNSIVCKITYRDVSLLFTGDLEAVGRARLLRSSEDLRANVLKVAHHGSHNGTSEELLQRVLPQEAVISSGNQFGHPHREALEMLENIRARLWRTDRQGTIRLSTNGRTIRIRALGRND